LAKLVFWPLRSATLHSRLIFVPDDALHTVPFNVLPWSSNPEDKLIVNHAEAAIVPSALFLTRLRTMARTHSVAPRIELIGDPVFRIADWRHECADNRATGRRIVTQTVRTFSDWTESLPRLPGSRAEVQSIAQLARQSRSGSRVETFLGCAAVAGALRQAATDRVDLLHIATHARVDAQRPRLSALALTPEPGSHAPAATFGLLDILALKLNSSLVVLSACDTSRGRLLPGEGVLGPAQAFLQAGAQSVLASYWRVDDEATSSFMQRFYHYLLVEHLPAGSSLRKAQLEAAAVSPSYDWAAFALYGWPDATL
jgi:CHAT domain-containing protein